MSHATFGAAVLVTGLLLARPAAAQDKQEILELKGTPTNFTVGTGTPRLLIPRTGNLTLRISCSGSFDCTKVDIKGQAADQVQAIGTPTKATRDFVVPGGASSIAFSGSVEHRGISSTNQMEFASEPVPGGPSGSGNVTLAQQVASWLATPCPIPAGLALPGASIVMTPFGQVISRSQSRFDNEDVVTVAVYADDRVKHLLDVKMASDLAQPVVTNIYGADQAPFARQSLPGEKALPAPTCSFTAPENLGPFASPKGVVKVTVYDGTAVKELGSTEFVVAPLYTGTFTLGGVSTEVQAPTFAKAFNGQDTVIARRDEGRRILYTAMYTHFWRKRDLTRGIPSDRLYEAFTPMVGVVLNDVAANAIVGGSVELRPGFAFVAGSHWGRVTKLDESTGAKVGAEFENRGEVPTNKGWEQGWFYGLSIDVRAAGALLQSVLGGGSSSK